MTFPEWLSGGIATKLYSTVILMGAALLKQRYKAIQSISYKRKLLKEGAIGGIYGLFTAIPTH